MTHAGCLIGGNPDRLRSIEAGQLADIIAVPGDPLAGITVLQRVSFAMKDGVTCKR